MDLSSPPPIPPGLDLTEDMAPTLYGAALSTLVIAYIAVGLRFWCRHLTKVYLWWDDWLVLIGLLMGSILTFTTLGWMVPNGLGRHVWASPPDAPQIWAKGLMISFLSYTICLSTVKWSILFFYWRIFGGSRQNGIRIPLLVIAAMVGAWCIAVFIISLCQCFPTHAWWDRFNPAIPQEVRATYECKVVPVHFFIGNAVPNIVTDFLIVILPIPFIWNLRMGLAQKTAIGGIFIIGLFIVGVSIARLVILHSVKIQDPDITWNFSDTQMWTMIEQHVAVLCACLPSLRALLAIRITTHGIEFRKSTTRDDHSNRPSKMSWRPKRSDPDSLLETQGDFYPLKSVGKVHDGISGANVQISHTRGADSDVEAGGIRMERTIQIEHAPSNRLKDVEEGSTKGLVGNAT